MAGAIICPQCETSFSVKEAEKEGGCPNCKTSLAKIAALPRRRAPKKVQTITLWRFSRWDDDLGSATYKLNPTMLTLLEDHSKRHIFSGLDRIPRSRALGEFGYDGVFANADTVLRKRAESYERAVHHWETALRNEMARRDKFYEKWPQARDLYLQAEKSREAEGDAD